VRFSSLRSRDFRLLIAGQAVSLSGSSMQQVAVVWQLYLLTGSPLSLGMLGLFRVTPILLLALGGGVAADALDRRKLMIASQTGMMLASLGLLAATHMGVVTPGIIYALAALGGVASAFDPPARQALVTQLVPVEALPNAFSLYMTAYQIAAVAGPALGGALLAWSGVEPIYLLDVISYLAVIVALLAMEHKAPTRGLSQMSAAAAMKPPTSHNCTGRLYAADQLWFARTYGCQLSSVSTMVSAMTAATHSSHRPGARRAAAQSRAAATASSPSGTRCSSIYPINRMQGRR